MNTTKALTVAGTALLCVAVLLACGRKNETVNGGGDKVKDEKKTYSFVDVSGEEYEAPLLEDVPSSRYKLSRIVEKNGFKYYTDKEGEVISWLGIDVSEYQNAVDWKKVKDAGIDYTMIRIGYRGYGKEGKLVEDKKFKDHMDGAGAAGIPAGVYFFSQAVNDEEVLKEADFVIKHLSEYKITCPVAFDTEEIKFDDARTDGLSKEQFTRNCRLFCDTLEDAGYDTMIYTNMKWLAFTLNPEELKEYGKWYADYESLPQCPYEFSMWQYTETGQVPGVEGNVDLNVWFAPPKNEKSN